MNKKSLILLIFLLSGLIMCFLPLSVAVDHITLNPIRDSDIQNNLPDLNCGMDTIIEVRYLSGPLINHVCMEFDLSCVAGKEISRATLKIKVSYHGGSPILILYPIASYWEETLITWNNKPSKFATPMVTTTAEFTTETWNDINVTSIVNTWLAESRVNYGFYIETDTLNSYICLYTRNAAAEDRPILYIEFPSEIPALGFLGVLGCLVGLIILYQIFQKSKEL